MAERGIFGLRIEPKVGDSEEGVMRAMDELFQEQPRQGFNKMVNAVSRASSTGDRIEAAAIVFSRRFADAMEQRGYIKRYEEEMLDNGETRQYCVGFERVEE